MLLSLDATEITDALVYPGSLWREVRVVAETGSTNADLLAAAGAGTGEGTVLVAEAQTAGRGRLDRRWASPPRAGLTLSVLLRPGGVPAALLGWLPLLAGVAAAAAVRRVTTVAAVLKWPNDVLVGDAKLGGILAERTGTAVVIGIGINVWQGQRGPAAGRGRHLPGAGGRRGWRRPGRGRRPGPARAAADGPAGRAVALVPGLAGPGQPGGRGRVRAAPGVPAPVRHAGPAGDRDDAGRRAGHRDRGRGGPDRQA